MLKKQRSVDFLAGSLLKNVLFFAVPLIFSSILQLLFNAADVIVVGKFAGSHELAAVGSTTATVSLLVNFCIGFAVGTNVVVAQKIGERDREGIRKSVHSAMLLSILFGLFFGGIGVFFAHGLLHLLSTPQDIIASASAYLRIYFLGLPATIVYNFGAAILRAKGDTMRPLYYLTFAGILNVILNLIMVIACKMGAVGVGIATAVSQYLSAVLIVLCLRSEDGALHLSLRKLRLYKDVTLKIVRIGLPAGIQSSLFSVSNMLVQASINSFNSAAIVAGNSAAQNIEGFIYVAMNAFYQSSLTLAGQNKGAGQLKRIDKGLLVCCGYVSLVGLALSGLLLLFGSQLLSVYSNDPEVITYGLRRFPYVGIPYFLAGLMDTVMGAVRGVGYSMLPMCVTLFGCCLFRIIWLTAVFPLHHALETIYIVYPLSWILTLSAHLVCYLLVRKRARKLYTAAASETV